MPMPLFFLCSKFLNKIIISFALQRKKKPNLIKDIMITTMQNQSTHLILTDAFPSKFYISVKVFSIRLSLEFCIITSESHSSI